MKSLDERRARERFSRMKEDASFKHVEDLDEDAKSLRRQVEEVYDPHAEKFARDRSLGLCLYKHCTNLRDGESVKYRHAADSDFWRYLACNVLPDFTHQRHGAKEEWFCGASERVKDDSPDSRRVLDRRPWRIWPKRAWWTIHLVWQGDEERTGQVLDLMTTDWVLNLVERAGPEGFRVEVARAIMAEILERSKRQKFTEGHFSNIMVVATGLQEEVEPLLVEGGPRGFATNLLDYCLEME